MPSRRVAFPARLRIDSGSAAIGLVSVFTVVAMAMAPLGVAAAAFSARAVSVGNSWATAGPATRLAFTSDPSDSAAAVAFGTQPVVAVLDARGHTVDVSSAPVTLSLTNPAGATLTCTTNPQAAVSGVATFAGCAVDDAGTYTLTATSGTLVGATSASFTIATGSATSLSFTTDPSNSTGAVAFATQPVVEVQDAGGNTVTSSTAPVTLTITTPAGATLSCTTNPKAAVAGVATFAGCRIDKAGTYSLTATSGTLTSNTSADLTITVGPANRLTFTTSPSFSNAGIAFFVQPVVAVQDAGGNPVTSSTASVALSLTTPGGASLTCTANPKAAVAGVVTYAGCRVDLAGTYTLTASSTGLTSAVSGSFTISVGSTTKLAFTANPSSSTGGTPFATQPAVAIQDAGGNTVTSSTAPVTLVLTTPGGATLACTANPKPAVAGVAVFAGCNVDKPGTYTLTAASTGLTNAVSTSFTITVGVAAKLAFTTSPSNGVLNTTLATQPVVTVLDAGGNTVATSTAPVTLVLTTPGGATLTCTANPKSALAGVATFAGCRVSLAGNYTLTATSGTLASAVSASFVISSGAVKLAFTRNPSTPTAVNTAFSTQPRVAVQNAAGTTVTTPVTSITLTLTPPAGTANLTCTTNPANTSSGVVRFAGCKIDTLGTYTLTASATGLTSAVSTSLTITAGSASKLGFTISPSGSTGGTVLGTQPVVAVQDTGGNTVTTATSTVTLTITTPAGATLTCTTNPKAAVAGLAAFAGCKIDKAGTYTLTATASGLTSAVSGAFTITTGPATKLGFTTNPSSSTGGTVFGTQPVVAVQDAGGNTVTTATSTVTLGITTAGGATLTCTTNPKAAIAGLAAFTGCKVDRTGTYTLTATASGLTTAVSTNFTISIGTATTLVFTTSPSNAVHNVAFATQPVVAVQDAGGNTVTSSSTAITLSMSSGGATLTCTQNPLNASAGLATFAGCRINTAGTYTLKASASGGLTAGVSNTFTVS